MAREKSELPRNEDGEKLYPICNWEKNRSKLVDMYERARVGAYETGEVTEIEEMERIEKLIEEFDACVIDGTAYITWQHGQEIKLLIHAQSEFMMAEMRFFLDRCDVSKVIGWEEFDDSNYEPVREEVDYSEYEDEYADNHCFPQER